MIKKLLVSVTTVLVLFAWLKAPSKHAEFRGDLIAFHGGGQLIDEDTMDPRCRVRHVRPSGNLYIENTLPAIRHAVELGVGGIYLSIWRTSDNDFAVFHSDRLECATNGQGKIGSFSLVELQDLDAGYGYTQDKGTSYPWRNQGLIIHSLREIVEVFPQQTYWLSLKSDDRQSIESLMNYLSTLPLKSQKQVVVISSDNAVKRLRAIAPDLLSVSQKSMETCLKDYALYGWSRLFPASCKRTVLVLPISDSIDIWGWPETFAARMKAHNTQVFLISEYASFDTDNDMRDKGVGIISGDLTAFHRF